MTCISSVENGPLSTHYCYSRYTHWSGFCQDGTWTWKWSSSTLKWILSMLQLTYWWRQNLPAVWVKFPRSSGLLARFPSNIKRGSSFTVQSRKSSLHRSISLTTKTWKFQISNPSEVLLLIRFLSCKNTMVPTCLTFLCQHSPNCSWSTCLPLFCIPIVLHFFMVDGWDVVFVHLLIDYAFLIRSFHSLPKKINNDRISKYGYQTLRYLGLQG